MELRYYDTKGAAEYLNSLGLLFRAGTLCVWRSQGKGPRYKKIARKVFYEKTALDEFAKGHTVDTVDSGSLNK
jgi:hypothetical protein